jgi:PTS system N-acetylglucosamine-specific IIC component
VHALPTGIDWNLAKTMADHPDRSGLRALDYVIFRFAITKFDLKTPGREPEEEVEDSVKA